MPFESFLGNARLKENLISSLRKGRTSHFYLISGPAGSGKKHLARLLAAAMMCSSPEKPCLQCPGCRKVMNGSHPDFITVEDPEHKNVAVKLVRQFREDVFIRPNEGAKKVYLFPQELGLEGQNALLKILEEPPAYGVFLLLTDNAEKLLPTVRSRCVELKLQPLEEAVLRRALRQQFPEAEESAVSAAILRSGGFLGQAEKLLSGETAESPQTRDFAESFAAGNALLLTQTLVPMEKWKRDQLLETLQQWAEVLSGAIAARAGLPGTPLAEKISAGRSGRDLHEAMGHLQKAMQYARSNVSVAAVCGYLAWALR